jgi:hypothetical protein
MSEQLILRGNGRTGRVRFEWRDPQGVRPTWAEPHAVLEIVRGGPVPVSVIEPRHRKPGILCRIVSRHYGCPLPAGGYDPDHIILVPHSEYPADCGCLRAASIDVDGTALRDGDVCAILPVVTHDVTDPAL